MASITDNVSVSGQAVTWMLLYELARIGMKNCGESEETRHLTDKGVDQIHQLMEAIAGAAMPVILEAIKE